MASQAQIESARRNGALSRGPVTPEGRRKSSQNSLKTGLHSSKMFVLDNESLEIFEKLVAGIVEQYQPATQHENELCLDIAHARWRLRRVWTIETAMFDRKMDAQAEELRNKLKTFDEGTRVASAFESLAIETSAFGFATRYEARLRRAFDRAVDRLLKVQNDRRAANRNEQNEPERDPQN